MSSVAFGVEPQVGWRRFMGRSGFAVGTVLACFAVLFFTAEAFVRATADVEETHRLQAALARTQQGLTDAETAQRGYFLTGRIEFLAPSGAGRKAALDGLTEFERVAAERELHDDRLTQFRPLVEAKLAELEETLRLERERGLAAALEVVHSGHGNEAMRRIRMLVSSLQEREAGLRAARERRARTASVLLFLITSAAAVVLAWLLWTVLSRLEREIEAEAAQVRALERVAEEQRLAREEREWLLGELHHRVKNSLQQIEGILRLQIREEISDVTRDSLTNALHRIMAIGRVHERLYAGDRPDDVDVAAVLGTLCEELSDVFRAFLDGPITSRSETISMPIETSIPLMLIANELITNACRHGSGPGKLARVAAVLRQDEGSWILEVSDEGGGRPEMADRLGMTLVRRLAQRIGGSVVMEKRSPGLSARVLIPREAA